MPRINLLPWRDLERKRKRQEFMFAAAGAVVVALLAGLLVRMQYSAAIDHQNERNQYLDGQIQILNNQIAEILDLEKQKQRLKERIEVIQKLQSSRPEAVHLFDQLVKLLPDGVYLTSVKQTDRRIQIKGVAESSTRVSAFMRNIDGSEWLKDPSLEIIETKGSGDSGSNFTLYANQVNKDENSDDKSPKAKPGPRKIALVIKRANHKEPA
ncbi:MAG TPA: PilN domain-containing protein [Steroidobacteraceae bacterium]|nr:PilN domain-containing protein [Steroidobacteraceae bacterium]